MKKIVLLPLLALTACGLTPGARSPQEKLDHGTVACRQGKQFLYVVNHGYSSSWIQLIGDDGKPERC